MRKREVQPSSHVKAKSQSGRNENPVGSQIIGIYFLYAKVHRDH